MIVPVVENWETVGAVTRDGSLWRASAASSKGDDTPPSHGRFVLQERIVRDVRSHVADEELTEADDCQCGEDE